MSGTAEPPLVQVEVKPCKMRLRIRHVLQCQALEGDWSLPLLVAEKIQHSTLGMGPAGLEEMAHHHQLRALVLAKGLALGGCWRSAQLAKGFPKAQSLELETSTLSVNPTMYSTGLYITQVPGGHASSCDLM